MLESIIYGLIWCFSIYGMLVMIQEILKKSSYDKIKENTRRVLWKKSEHPFLK